MSNTNSSSTAALQSLIVSNTQVNTKLSKTVADLIKAAQDLAGSSSAQQDLVDQIAQRQAEIASLDVQYTEKSRQASVEFDLELKADALRKVSEVLSAQGKVAIASSDLLKLQSDYKSLSDKFNEALEAEVLKVRNQERANATIQIRTKELELAAATANEKAQINSLTEKNALLAKNVADLQLQINADRDARVKEAQARGNAVVNVASGK